MDRLQLGSFERLSRYRGRLLSLGWLNHERASNILLYSSTLLMQLSESKKISRYIPGHVTRQKPVGRGTVRLHVRGLRARAPIKDVGRDSCGHFGP